MGTCGFGAARKRRIVAAAVGISLLAGAAGAQALGERAYNESCGTCHGVGGSGDSIMNDYLTQPAPSLTGLSKANGGVFPMAKIVKIIDGRQDVRAHGSSMPVWGSVFREPLQGEIRPDVAELVTKGRILALAEYIESLQK